MTNSSASIVPVGSGPESAAKVNVKVVGGPEGIALSPDGKELWVGSRDFNGISIIDTATEQVIATVAPGTFAYRLTFSPDGRHVFAPRSGKVAIFDVTTRKEVRTINLQSMPISVLLMPDNRTMYVGTVAPNEVVKIDLTTGEIEARVAMTGTPDGLAYSTYSPPPASRRRYRSVRH
jgi:YVTN family beta-propeller protein